MENILIVDDEKAILEMMAETVSRWGYNPIVADNGEAALEKIHNTAIDLLLTDFRLPKHDGIELVKEMKEVDPSAKVILFTGYSGLNNAIDAFKAGVSDYLIKPVDLAELHEKIEQHLNSRKANKKFKTLKSLNWGMLISIPIWLILGIIFINLLR
ncbi:MAG: response regulator [Deferribacteres bacterium]|nr:response regulator [candidate division KSB1 bacterium]MCB9502077.1 response regulator [Deferribacteres bacterium]